MPLALMFLGILCSVAGSFPLYTYAIHLSDHDIRWTSRERLRPRIYTDLEKRRRPIVLEVVSLSVNITFARLRQAPYISQQLFNRPDVRDTPDAEAAVACAHKVQMGMTNAAAVRSRRQRACSREQADAHAAQQPFVIPALGWAARLDAPLNDERLRFEERRELKWGQAVRDPI